jgi:hypothetical protein
MNTTDRILGESSDWDLFLLTKKLAAILNSFEGADIEDTSPYTPDWAEGHQYDTSGETEDLQSLRQQIVEWANEARNLLPDNKDALLAVRSMLWTVRHHMRHQPGSCLYNISWYWDDFLRNNPQGPQLAHEIVGWSGRRKYRAVSNSALHDVLSGDALGDDIESAWRTDGL